MHFDWQTIAVSLGGILTGIGAVQVFLHKWLPITKKYITLASKSIVVLDQAAKALEDDNLSASEWDALKINIIDVSNAWKDLKVK